MSAAKTSGTAGAKAAAVKSPRGDRAKRLLDLVMLLLRHRTPVTFRDIREQFTSYQTANVEAGLRAFERDKADLLELGVPIRYVTPDEDDALEDGGYVIEIRRYALPEVHLTADEVSALVLAASVVRAVPGVSYASVVDLALRKLAFDSPERPDTPTQSPLTAREPVLVHFPEREKKRDRALGDRFSQLEAATRRCKRTTFTYRSASNGMASKRDFDPYGLFYREGSWLAVGYCHLRKEVRSFRLDRMSDLKIAPKPKSPDFERPGDFDIRAYANRSPWTFATSPQAKVVLEVMPEVASVANEDFGPDATVRDGKDGAKLVEFSCGNIHYAVSRVLSAKGGIAVREGDRLREALADELAAVRRNYR